MTREELNKVLLEHKLWLESDGEEGKRANLSGANLSDAYLSGADLSHINLYRADLSYADLSHADLFSADLFSANLIRANLSAANLSGANLSNVNLSGANLFGANLFGANLSGADLLGADLSYANLSYANLSGADLSGADLNNVSWNEVTTFFDLQCPEKGSFIAYKKCRDGVIVELLIPEDAKRSSATSRKCRCDKAVVLEIVDDNGDQIETAVSNHDGDFIYKVGETVKVDNFNEDRWRECSTGIHFFITRAEAENY